MELKNYQKNAVDRLLVSAQKLLNKEGSPRICVFKAPTGSGKTIMMADFLENLAKEEKGRQFAFIWISGHDLHAQSKTKLEQYMPHSRYTSSFLDEKDGGAFGENEIVFVNWHSLAQKDKEGNWKNVFMRDNEEDRNLPAMAEATHEEGREIILIVDESHSHYWSARSQEIVQEVIKPKLIIEVSATPFYRPDAEEMERGEKGFVSVAFEDVVAEGVIKKDAIINKEIGKYAKFEKAADEVVIDAAILERGELLKQYKKEKSEVNPLVLIQLPSEGADLSALDQSKLEKVKRYLDSKHGINIKNGKLAIWLSKEKENLAGISDNVNEVEVLIFKQAIALGWDCPRAQILVMFREIKEPTFEIQVVGRIMRMPELKHYGNDDLDRAYIYTNVSKVVVAKDDESIRYFNIYPAKRKHDYKQLELPSVYLHRLDYGDLTLVFRALFLEEASKYFGITKKDDPKSALKKADKELQLELHELTEPVIADAVFSDIDKKLKQEITGGTANFAVPEDEIKNKFQSFAKLASLPYAPVRSHTKIQQAIYDWFDGVLGYTRNSRLDIQRIIVCSEENQKIFLQVIERAKKRFESVKIEEQKAKKRRKDYIWDVPAIDYFNEQYEKVIAKNCVLQPCYLRRDRSLPEKNFEKYISKNSKAVWWYKNGAQKEGYFAIEYKEKGMGRAFYPDYIVFWKNGEIGIYDTKSGFTADSTETAEKALALKRYIASNKKLKLRGGIIREAKTGWQMLDDDWINIREL